MSKTLEQIRDELAKAWSDKPEHNQTIVQACISESDFKAGFDAALKALGDVSGEFEESYFKDRASLWLCDEKETKAFIAGASEQFEKCKAQLGLKDRAIHMLEFGKYGRAEMQKKISELERELASFKELVKGYQEIVVPELERQVESAQARVAELEGIIHARKVSDHCDAVNAMYPDGNYSLAEAEQDILNAEALKRGSNEER